MSSIGSIQMLSRSFEAFAAQTQRSSAPDTSDEQLFASVDSDGDGQLSRAESDAALQSAQPQSFDLSALSTQGFAGMCGAGRAHPPLEGHAGGDPIAALDSDGDGSVSAEEFGLDGSSSAMQKLFGAMDSDGNGELSKSETDAFRTAMHQAAGGADRPHGPPPGPPPGAKDDASSSGSSASDASASTDHAQLREFLQRLAEMFASQYSDTATGTSSNSTSTVSLTA